MKKQNRKVLIISNFFPPLSVGGAEVVAFRQALGLIRIGFEVTVFCGVVSGDLPGTLTYEIYDGLPVFRMRLRSLDASHNYYWHSCGRKLTALLNYIRPDIVHFHNVSGLGAFLISLTRYLGFKAVVTLHDHWGFCFKNTLLKNSGSICGDFDSCASCAPRIEAAPLTNVPILLRRDFVAWCLSEAEVLISPSHYLAGAYVKSKGISRDVHVLSNGIGIPKTSSPLDISIHTGVVRFACFIHLGEHKGLRTLMRAVSRLHALPAMKGRWTLTIAGDGVLKSFLADTIRELGATAPVTHVGMLPHRDALALLQASDVVILPSIWPENEPVSLLEALAFGKAQIASRIGGNPELVEHGKSGLLFDPGDDGMLADAMMEFISTPAIISQYGAYNRSRRDKFDEALALESLTRLYDRIARENRPAKTPKRFVIACCGSLDDDRIDILLNKLHKIALPDEVISLVWHEWVDNHLWSDVSALWVWGRGEASDWPVILKALRAGLPVIVAENSDYYHVSRQVDPALCYRTWQDALEIILSLPSVCAELDQHAERRVSAGRLLSQAQDHRDLLVFAEGPSQ